VIQSKLVVDDFLKAISRVAPAWIATFTRAGSNQNKIERRQIMKLFREHISLAHPTRGKSKSAFITAEAAHAASGKSDLNTQRDASSILTRAPPTYLNQRQSNKRKMNAPGNKPRQSQKRDTVETRDVCPACKQRHNISNYFYVHPNLETPEWFRPNPHITKLVQYKLQHEPSLQKSVQETTPNKKPRNTSSSRSITPYIKPSHTPDKVNK
jgi:hypothetical protein